MEKSIKRASIMRLLFAGIVLLIFTIIGNKVLKDDFGEVMTWWLTLVLLGITFYPLSMVIFGKFRDGGWIFSKGIGLALSGWLLWYLSSVRIFKFTRTNAVITIGICLALNLVLVYFMGKKKKLEFNMEKLSCAAVSEALFFMLFISWCFLKGFKPEAYGTEKFMDYGFMTTMMRSEYMPPQDLWLSGENINYYYLGQYLATYFTKLSGVTVGRGYNLFLMTVAAFGFTMPYSIISNVASVFIKDKYGDSSRRYGAFAPICGAVAGIAVSFSSNMQFTLYKYVLPKVRDLLGITEMAKNLDYEFPSYWFPNATRYIGYFPETTDKTIHEFPLYSFVLGDLHAHVANIIFVLTVVAILLAWTMYRKDQEKLDFKQELLRPEILLLGFFVGLFHMTNYWDYPIYFVVSGAVILFSNLKKYRFTIKAVWLTAAHAAEILLISAIVCLPFTLSFDQISSEINLCSDHTPLYQLIILWGVPALSVIAFVINRIGDLKERGYFGEGSAETITVKVGDRTKTKVIKRCGLFVWMDKLSTSDMFVTILGLCALGLVLIPELVYVKDIYTGDYKRANTMFKLTYQAYILFGLAMGYMLPKLLIFIKKRGLRIFSGILLVMLFSTSLYFFESTKAWFGDYTDLSRYKTLDASAFIENESKADAELIAWLNENVEGTPVVLEKNGASYSFHERVSVLTGLPTVLGWKTHEWLWRSSRGTEYPPELTEREQDIEAIYCSNNEAIVRSLIDKYDITYIYVGKLEMEGFDSAVNAEFLKSLGTVVAEHKKGDGEKYDSFIVKVK